MSSPQPTLAASSPTNPSVTDLMIRSDGVIYARNLTPDLAGILSELNPDDPTMTVRAARATSGPAGPAQRAPST